MTNHRLASVQCALVLDSRTSMHLRLVEPSDAAFILDLRRDEGVNRFISPTPPQLANQRTWIEAYKEREARGDEFYFVAVAAGRAYGTVRLSDFRDVDGVSSFDLGSFVMLRPPPLLAVYAYLVVCEIAFRSLHFDRADFRIRRDNARARSTVAHLGARVVGIDGEDAVYCYLQPEFERFKAKFSRRFDHSAQNDPLPGSPLPSAAFRAQEAV